MNIAYYYEKQSLEMTGNECTSTIVQKYASHVNILNVYLRTKCLYSLLHY